MGRRADTMKKMLLRIAACLTAAAAAAAAQAPPGKAFGNQAAPLRIEVFSDFQCPACKNLHEGALAQVHREYVRAGKVYLIHREFPLPMHRYAREAAAYATAAARLNRYEAVAAALFRQQASWSTSGNVEAVVASVVSPAEMQKLRALVRDPQTQMAIEQDIALGKQNALSQTPTMVITKGFRRYPVGGNQNYAILKRFLDDLLSK